MQEFADQIGAVRHSTCTKLFFWKGFDQKKVCRHQSTTFGTTFPNNTEDLDNLKQKTRFKIRQLWRIFVLLTKIFHLLPEDQILSLISNDTRWSKVRVDLLNPLPI